MLIYIKKSVLYTPLIMKMNVYADKCALKYKKEGGYGRKTDPVCVMTRVWYLCRGSVISYWDDQ